MHKLILCSDYKSEWLKLKQKKEEEAGKQKENVEKELLTSPGIGETVPLVTSINSGREIADVYLKHPGNESSEDSEGEEVNAREEDGKFCCRCEDGSPENLDSSLRVIWRVWITFIILIYFVCRY